MNIETMIQTLESQIAVLSSAVEALRLVGELVPVAVQPKTITRTKPRVSNGTNLLGLVLDAVGHGNHDAISVTRWLRKHGGFHGRNKKSVGPAMATLAGRGKLVRLSPGVYHLPKLEQPVQEN